VTLALSGWWLVGWGVALVVVALVALLLVAIIMVGRRIVRQADGITEALDGARANTGPLFGVRTTNHVIDRITRGLAAVRTGGAP
jgi:preprotein translocase subunit SecG